MKLNGKPFEAKPLTPSATAILKFLDKSPADEVFTSRELAERVGITHHITKDEGHLECFGSYSIIHRAKRLWGSRKAIAELRKLVGQ